MYRVGNRLDLGGTCFATYHGQFPIFASKTDQIMSRYRPIAPKPSVATSSPGGSNSAVDSQSSSSPRVSIRKGGAESGRANRIRKRISDSSGGPPSRGQKRARVPNHPIDLPSEARLDKSLISSVTAVDGPFRYALDCRASLVDTSGNLHEKDLGFMERAAASASPGVLSERTMDVLSQQKSLGVGGRGLSGMMDRIGVECNSENNIGVVAMQALLTNSDMRSVSRSGFYSNSEDTILPIAPCLSDLEQEISPPEEKEAGGKKLVTLPLLPETPSCKDSILGSCISDVGPLNADIYQEPNYMQSSSSDEVQLRLSTKEASEREAEPAKGSSQTSRDTSTTVPVLDLSYLEHMYSASLEPVILLLDNDSHCVLWFNLAYKTMVEDAEERSNTPRQPLIINATPLASFIFKSMFQATGTSKATLWRFTKKFTGRDITAVSDQDFPDIGDHSMPLDSSSSGAYHHQQMQRSADDVVSAISLSGQCVSLMKKGVIMPQPVRPVGSSVSIEYIKDTILQNFALRRNMEEIEEQLESETVPAIMSDSKNRVRFTNSAYKKMVGQPECSWLESTVCNNNKSEGFTSSISSCASNRINGEVTLNCKLPFSASALSCCVKIQWSNNSGEKSSIRAPCDIVRITTCDPKDHVYGWKFHIAAALSFNGRV